MAIFLGTILVPTLGFHLAPHAVRLDSVIHHSMNLQDEMRYIDALRQSRNEFCFYNRLRIQASTMLVLCFFCSSRRLAAAAVKNERDFR